MAAVERGAPVHLERPGPEPVGLGRFGEFGGRYAPETLVPALEQLEREFRAAWHDDAFRAEYASLLTGYRALLVLIAVLYAGAFALQRLQEGRPVRLA